MPPGRRPGGHRPAGTRHSAAWPAGLKSPPRPTEHAPIDTRLGLRPGLDQPVIFRTLPLLDPPAEGLPVKRDRPLGIIGTHLEMHHSRHPSPPSFRQRRNRPTADDYPRVI